MPHKAFPQMHRVVYAISENAVAGPLANCADVVSVMTTPKKFVVYRWRTSPEMLAALRAEPRRRKISLDTLLSRITTWGLRKRRAEQKIASARLKGFAILRQRKN